jgi:hypothetical protein
MGAWRALRGFQVARNALCHLFAVATALVRSRQNLDIEFLEPARQQVGGARVGVYDQYPRRRWNLFEIVPAFVPRDCSALIAGQRVDQRFAQLLPKRASLFDRGRSQAVAARLRLS